MFDWLTNLFGGGQKPQPTAQPSLQNARYGVLANNPAAQQQFLNSIQASHFNPLTAGLSSAVHAPVSVAKGLASGVVNTAQLPYKTGEYAANKFILDNRPAAAANLQNLTSTYNNSIPGNMITPAYHAANAIAATPLGYLLPGGRPQDMYNRLAQGAYHDAMSRGASPQQAQQVHDQIIAQGNQQILQSAGFNATDSPFTVGRKFVSNAGQTALNVASMGESGAAASDVATGGIRAALPDINKAGLAMGGANTLQATGQNNVKLRDLPGAFATGYVSGSAMAALPVAAHELGSTIQDHVPLNQDGSISNPFAKKFNGLAANQIINSPQDIKNLQDFQQAIYDQKAPPVDKQNAILQSLHNIKQNNGLDFLSGSNMDRANRIADYLDQHAGALQDYQAYLAKPHVGTDQMGAVGKNIRSGDQAATPNSGETYSWMRNGKIESGTIKAVDKNNVTWDNGQQEALSTVQSHIQNGVIKQGPTTSATPKLPPEGQTPKESAQNLPGSSKGSIAAGDKLDAQNYAETFGISKDQAVKEMSSTTKAPTRKVPEQKTPLTAAENTAKNPLKVNVPEVQPGDYAKARSNAQLASNPIQYSMGQTIKAVQKLKISNSDFGKMVEDPSLAKTAAQKAAVARYNDMTNRAHATSQALGGNTNYIPNYFRHVWDLSKPEDAAKFQELASQLKSKQANPYDFAGIDTQPRVFKSIKQGEAAGFHLANTDPVKEILDYGNGSAYALRTQALAKGFAEAERGQTAPPTRNLDLGNGKTLPLSEVGFRQARSFDRPQLSDNPLAKGYRAGNRGLKQTLLSVSEFHPINVAMLKAAPALTAAGHPMMAVKGAFDTFRSQIGSKYADNLQQHALADGTVENAARIGTPIKFGSDYSTEGKLAIGKAGLGERTIFEKAMPAMHMQMVRGVVADLQKHNISLDSPAARSAGTRINEIMGFVNNEVKNSNPHVQRTLSDLLLAPQFTRAKWATLKGVATDKGLIAKKYAAGAVVGNVAADVVLAAGIGAALHQKSDNLKDLIIRSLIHPSIPTPLKDAKGNTIELGLPSNYVSEAAGLVSKLTRNQNGHLGVSVSPGNLPSGLANYGRSRLAVIPSTALKIATNTDFAGKPLYDPQASVGTQAAQAATTIGTGLLPIGLQGLSQTNAVKSHLPQSVQQVLNASSSGQNPMIKSLASSFGLTPRTDKTVGKGLQTSQYYNALNQATSGLSPNDQAAWSTIHPQSKNPVTGQNQLTPTVWNTQDKAVTYLNHPNVLAADNKLNQTLAQQGQKVDPFFTALSPQQQKVFLTYESLPPQYRYGVLSQNPWITQFQGQRTNFFNSLPGAPSTSSGVSDIPTYPQPSTQVTALKNQYYALPNNKAKAAFVQANPSLAQQFALENQYANAVNTAQNLPTQALSKVKQGIGTGTKTRVPRASGTRSTKGRTARIAVARVPRVAKISTKGMPKSPHFKIARSSSKTRLTFRQPKRVPIA